MNRDGADAESPFPLFFSFSASFKNSSPREKVGKLSSFWDWWAESLFVSIIVAKYIIFPRANNGRSREKKNFWRSDLLTLSACTIGILSTLTYTKFDCAAPLAMSITVFCHRKRLSVKIEITRPSFSIFYFLDNKQQQQKDAKRSKIKKDFFPQKNGQNH